jgi:hypothetical protein
LSAVEKEFTYDVYISYVDREPDFSWVWQMLIPRLEVGGIDPGRIAVAGEVERPGVTLLLEAERVLNQSKRILLVLSNQYFDDPRTTFDVEVVQYLQIRREEFRLLPVIFADGLDEDRIPLHLDLYQPIDLSSADRFEQRFQRLIEELKRPLPIRR